MGGKPREDTSHRRPKEAFPPTRSGGRFLINGVEPILVKTVEDSILDLVSGEYIFSSLARFQNAAAVTNCCFLCTRCPDGRRDFNDEHVIPNWVLSEFDLHSERIGLPNDTLMTYGQYVVRACVACNSALADLLESKVSPVLRAPSFAPDEGESRTLFFWLCSLFVKTHIKSSRLRLHRDHRQPPKTIGETFDYSRIHHPFCLLRAMMLDIPIEDAAFGSILVYEAHDDGFDYQDSWAGNVVAVRFHRTFILCVLDDCGAVATKLGPWSRQVVNGPITFLQGRELVSRAVSLNLSLRKRPAFQTIVDHGSPSLVVELPEQIDFDLELEQQLRGEHLWNALPKRARELPATLEELGKHGSRENAIKSGTWTLFEDIVDEPDTEKS